MRGGAEENLGEREISGAEANAGGGGGGAVVGGRVWRGENSARVRLGVPRSFCQFYEVALDFANIPSVGANIQSLLKFLVGGPLIQRLLEQRFVSKLL